MEIFAIIMVVILIIFAFSYTATSLNGFNKKMQNRGFELICDSLWKKDDVVFYVSKQKMELAKPIEITGVKEITHNAKLVQLEIRYRMDGAIKSMKIGGSTDWLLTVEDKLGYSG